MATGDVKRKLTAIFSADVEGYSRLMEEDELATIETLTSHKEIMGKLIRQYRGRVVDSTGDNLLAEFASVVDAVQCAVEVQQVLSAKNETLPENRRMYFRIGINLGDVVEEGERIYGDGVNVAARVESLAEGGGISISGTAYDQLGKKLPLGYEYLGEQAVKNIEKPVRVYRVLTEAEAAGKVIGEEKPKPITWRLAVLGALIVILVAGVLAVWNFYLRPDIEPASVEKMAFPLPDKPSIAVLPFVNMSGDPEQEFFSDGITEQIITGLSQIPKLFVIARNSSFSYKGKRVKVQEVAEQLGVRYVLEGSVQRSAERIRITAQLIDAIKGHHLWAERYDRELKDIFDLQDEITMKIMTALQVELTIGEQAYVYAKGTDNLETYIKYLKGVEISRRRTKEDNAVARRIAKEAVVLDPNYAPPYTLLAWTHMMDIWLKSTKSPRQSLTEAIKLAQKSIALDDSFSRAHGLLGWLYTMAGQHDKGIAECERAVALNPNGFDAYNSLGIALRYAGRHEEAVRACEKSVRLNPFPSAGQLTSLGMAYFFTGRYDKAIEACKKAVQIGPNDPLNRLGLVSAYIGAGREEEARAEIEVVLTIDPKYTLRYVAKIIPYKNPTDKERAIESLRKAGLPDKPPLPLPDKPSIAVLPFVNMSGDPEQEYFSDGITESIITALSKAPRLFVISRSSTFTYKGKPVNVKNIGRELGVRYVLEGSIQRSGDRVRITAQLIDATTGSHVWAERYDRDLKDIFVLQDEITMKIVAALQLKLTEGETARLHLKGTDNLEAYTKWLQAHFYFNQYTPDDNVRARKILEQVIALDPGYPAAYSRLALTHVFEVYYNPRKATKERIQESIKLAQKALSMDDSDPLSRVALGRIYFTIKQYEKAIVELNEALALNPNLVEANRWLGFALIEVGKPEEALPFIKKALRLNPVEKGRTAALGLAYQRMGKYEEAIEAYKECVRFRPNHFFAHHGLVVCYVALNREEAAHAEAAEVFRINPNFSLEASEKRWPKGWEPALKARVYDVLRQARLK